MITYVLCCSDAAKKLGVKITSLSVNLNTSEEAERIKEIIAQAMVDVSTVR